jgi:hypothetical protein
MEDNGMLVVESSEARVKECVVVGVADETYGYESPYHVKRFLRISSSGHEDLIYKSLALHGILTRNSSSYAQYLNSNR